MTTSPEVIGILQSAIFLNIVVPGHSLATRRLESWLEIIPLPTTLKRGLYLLPTALVAEADTALQELAKARQAEGGTLRWHYHLLTVPTGLPPKLYDRELRKLTTVLEHDAEVIRALLRRTLVTLTTLLADALGPDDVSRRVFRDSKVENLTEFLRTVESRNIIGDVELADVAARVGGLVVAPDLVRARAAIRQRLREGLRELKPQLDALTAHRRAA